MERSSPGRKRLLVPVVVAAIGGSSGCVGEDCVDVACGNQGLHIVLVGGGAETTKWSIEYQGKRVDISCPGEGHAGEPGSVGCRREGRDLMVFVYDAPVRVHVRIIGDSSGRETATELAPDYETTHLDAGDCTLRCDEATVTLDWASSR